MNKQEVIEKIKRGTEYFSDVNNYRRGFRDGLNHSLLVLRSLDEPEKPVVPKYVADWIEWCKKNNITLLGACTAICNNKNIRSLDASGWARKNQETFAKAWLYEYEVEKRKTIYS